MIDSSRHAALPLVERLDSSVSPVEVFRRLSSLPHVIFLDSAMRHRTLGRYSFVAAAPIKWISSAADGGNSLAQLAKEASALTTKPAPDLPPFQGGWAGVFGYELGASLERVPAATIDEFNLPALAVGLYDVVVAFDHQLNAAWIISQGFPELDGESRRQRAADRLAWFQQLLSDPHPSPVNGDWQATPLPISELAPQFMTLGPPGVTSNFSESAYCRAVQQAIDYIYAGDIFQVNLSQRLLHKAVSSPIDLYCRLRERNPAPFAGYFDAGEWQIASASPERFIKTSHGHVETRPIKGTRGRAKRPEADLFAGDDLRASEKDRAENVMIVDLLRNDLSRTCLPHSVRVSQLCGLETYEYVQHLVSVVEAELRPNIAPIDVLKASFPGGSVTGAPKIRAMEIIAELEPSTRGPYCGSLGYMGFDGTMDTNILIRTVTSSRGWWQFPVGGGIVADSNPENEHQETWQKAAGILRSIHL